jgi:hypothetical protein
MSVETLFSKVVATPEPMNIPITSKFSATIAPRLLQNLFSLSCESRIVETRASTRDRLHILQNAEKIISSSTNSGSALLVNLISSSSFMTTNLTPSRSQICSVQPDRCKWVSRQYQVRGCSARSVVRTNDLHVISAPSNNGRRHRVSRHSH